jgi:ATP-binding cassette subfamily F protein uup
LELEDKTLYSYKGNYSYYIEKRAERIEVEQTTTAKAKQLYKKELDWMRRQPKARTTKSKSRIESFGEIKERAGKRRNDHKVELEINMERLGSKVLEMHHVSKGFEDNFLFEDFDYIFKKNERIGIIGRNGTGKSTFLNILTGQLDPDQGKVIHGETLKIGYYTQDGIKAKEGQKVIEVIRDYGDFIPLNKGRQISAQQLLEKFLFDRKKQYDFVEKLSGGEKKRLYLCTVLIQNPNFLILDEPTNDLDIVTLNVLENFLLDFPGCLIVVSHDRYFMDKIVDHLFVFGEGKVTDFPGNYSDYRDIKALELEAKYEESSQSSSESSTKSKSVPDQKSNLSFNEQKLYKKLEKGIHSLENRKEKLEAEFLRELNAKEVKDKTIELQDIQKELESKTEQWFELSMKIEG